MTTRCPSPLVRSIYADGELPAADAAALEAHLESCAACRARIGALRAERAALRALLADAELVEVAVPSFERPLGARGVALLGLGALGAGVFAASLWNALADAVPSGLHWLSPLNPSALLSLLLSLALFVTNEGFAMFTSTVELAALAVLVALLAYAGAALLKPRAGTAVLLSVLLIAAALPLRSHAFELRKSDGATTVPAGQTIDDTLLAFGQTVSIDGDVNGDLLAFGRVVTIRGHVTGDVITGGETVEIQGSVGGSVYAGGRGVTIKQTSVKRNLYVGGQSVSVETGVEIAGNAATAGDTVNVDGKVGADLMAAGNSLVVRGEVTRNVTAFVQTMTLLAPASVGGNLVAHVRAADNLQIAPGATVRGNVDKQISTGPNAPPVNKYLTTSFYTWQIVRLAAAFLAGLLLLWAFAGLRTASLADAGAGIKAGAIGLVTAIALPIVAFIACITVVGIPLGILAVILWLLGLYFAKVVVAQLIGRRLFASAHGVPHYAATLLAGLVVVFIAINLPWVGWLFGIAITVLGLGMILTYVSERSGRTL
jgi:anti-sigma factor RsiW/cytoskeletal protein CcmA (bactofilin family)